MIKLTGFAGYICLIAIVLLIQCPSLYPELSPVVHSAGAALGLYPKFKTVDISKNNTSFYYAPTTEEETTWKLIHEMSSK